MDHELQTGCPNMTTHYSQAMSCWGFSCLWGCVQWGCQSEQEANDAFLEHKCFG